MPYSSVLNHVLHASRYALVFSIFFILLPRIFFRSHSDSLLEGFFRNYIKSVFFFIILGYSLVLLKLYELLTVVAILIYLLLYLYRKKHSISSWEELVHIQMVWVYDIADGLIRPGQIIKDWLLKKKTEFKLSALKYFGSWSAMGYRVLFLSVFVYTAYLRFYDALKHAAPAMSDSYVVIAWIKYIDRKMLFRDGIYPQGFHTYLDFLHKFSDLDPLYIVNYSGPLHGVLITLSLYFVVTRWTGQRVPGVLVALIYGLLGSYLPLGWMRQAATNSQEFAFIFIMPALYFFSKYIEKGRRDDLITASAALFLIGLVHSLAFACVGLGMSLLLLLSLLIGWRDNLYKALRISLVGICGVVVAIIPVGIGLLMGKEFYGASAEFLLSQTLLPIAPELGIIDFLAGFAFVILLLFLLIKRKQSKELFAVGYTILFGMATFCLYYYGGVVTKNIVISSRSGELWGLIVPVVLGMGWYAISQLLGPLRNKVVQFVLGFCLICYIFFSIRPQPIIPYKMEYESGVEQYLHISTMLRPTEWMIVSQEEGYSLVYGKGYHLMLENFLELYNPYVKELKGCPVDIFIYHEKKVFWPDLDSSIMDYSIYENREIQNQKIKEWLDIYEKNHDNLNTFYEDDNLKIVRIHQAPSLEEKNQTIWGIK
ncbi:MAG: hypothetical protein CVU87_09510 [Firmicutes bacterium HGW-Firmicutes-12]|nr:MAG: hypothetical protein CVU87_09510 [Firmicutes bacterium HGW-Firmicutes-12]